LNSFPPGAQDVLRPVARRDGALGQRVRHRAGDDRPVGIAVDARQDHLDPWAEGEVHPVPIAAVGLEHPHAVRGVAALEVAGVEDEAHRVPPLIVELRILAALLGVDRPVDEAVDARLRGDALRAEDRALRERREAVDVRVRRPPFAERGPFEVRLVLDGGDEDGEVAVGGVLDGEKRPGAQLGRRALTAVLFSRREALLGPEPRHVVPLAVRLEMRPVLGDLRRLAHRQRRLAEEIDLRRAVVVVAHDELSRDLARAHPEAVHPRPGVRPGERHLPPVVEPRVAVGKHHDVASILLEEEERNTQVFTRARDEREIRLFVLHDELARRIRLPEAEREVDVGEA